jgi:hypothetical protein
LPDRGGSAIVAASAGACTGEVWRVRRLEGSAAHESEKATNLHSPGGIIGQRGGSRGGGGDGSWIKLRSVGADGGMAIGPLERGSAARLVSGLVKESVEEAVKKKKHTPSRDHQTKSGEKKKERFQKKAEQMRIQEKRDLEDAWEKWNKLRPDQQKMLAKLKPTKPDPRCQ